MRPFLLATASVGVLIAATTGRAADLSGTMVPAQPERAPPAAPPPQYNWTGCFVGAQAGFGWGHKAFSDVDGQGVLIGDFDPNYVVTVNPDGSLGGGQVGCNYQFNPNWVAGIEGAFSAADISATGGMTYWLEPVTAETKSLGSVTARIGHAQDRWMVYAKAGVAWADDRYTAIYGSEYQGSETRTGATIGAGLEWAFAKNLSGRVEYDYYSFGTRDVPFYYVPSPGTPSPETVNQNIQTVTFGINFRFGQH